MLATTKIAMNSARPPNAAVTALVAGEDVRAAGGGAQVRGIETGAGEHPDRIDPPGMTG